MDEGLCNKCGEPRGWDDVPDPCLGKLPGVISACCGHGLHRGHIRFTNGTRVSFKDVEITKGKEGRHGKAEIDSKG